MTEQSAFFLSAISQQMFRRAAKNSRRKHFPAHDIKILCKKTTSLSVAIGVYTSKDFYSFIIRYLPMQIKIIIR